MSTTTRPQASKTTDGRVKITLTGKYGDQMSQGMDEKETALFLRELLIKCLPDHHLTQYLLGKAQG
jgi:hypothetical protein